jgi:hypothetical protein
VHLLFFQKSSDGVVALDTFPFPLVATFLVPILNVTSHFTRMRSGAAEIGGGGAQRRVGEILTIGFLEVQGGSAVRPEATGLCTSRSPYWARG